MLLLLNYQHCIINIIVVIIIIIIIMIIVITIIIITIIIITIIIVIRAAGRLRTAIRVRSPFIKGNPLWREIPYKGKSLKGAKYLIKGNPI